MLAPLRTFESKQVSLNLSCPRRAGLWLPINCEVEHMTVIDKLATTLGRKDEVPNQILAEQIVSAKDREAVEELVENLFNRDRRIQSDCIKVLYEIGAANPRPPRLRWRRCHIPAK